MLEGILDLVKQQVEGAVSNVAGVQDDNKADVIHTATSAVMNELKNHFTPDNISALSNMFSSGAATGNNNVVNSLQSTVVSALGEKLGLSKEVAAGIAATAIPTVMKLFSDKVNDPNEPGFNVESLIETFTGNSGGILGMIGKLFGK